MLAFLKPKNPYTEAAHRVYAQILLEVRKPEFYEDYNVPDSFDGRFDLMLLHIFLVYERMLEENEAVAEGFNQALFDQTFKDMDQTLREMGIGDMGVPKHMRKMMKAFNGRMHAYDGAQTQSDFAQVLRKNLYGTKEDVADAVLDKAMGRVQEMRGALKQQGSSEILEGSVRFS